MQNYNSGNVFLNANLLSYLYRKETNNKASRTTQSIDGNLQSCYQKLICKIRQNFRESTLGNNLIVRGDTKKDKFYSNGAVQYALPAKAQESTGLLLQRLIRITECGKGDDEGKQATDFHCFFKEIMASTYIAKLFFDKCLSVPNRKLIGHTIKELFGWQRKAVQPLSRI